MQNAWLGTLKNYAIKIAGEWLHEQILLDKYKNNRPFTKGQQQLFHLVFFCLFISVAHIFLHYTIFWYYNSHEFPYLVGKKVKQLLWAIISDPIDTLCKMNNQIGHCTSYSKNNNNNNNKKMVKDRPLACFFNARRTHASQNKGQNNIPRLN